MEENPPRPLTLEPMDNTAPVEVRASASLLMDGDLPRPLTPELIDETAPFELCASGAPSVVSLKSLNALASMVIATLPFPPLPLMVSQGTDAESAMASSFDLLTQAIILQKTIGTQRPEEEIAKGKLLQLAELQQDMIRHCSEENNMDSQQWLDDAYEIYCKHFRSYFIDNYPTCSHDLRFERMDCVATSHVIMRQAASHVAASFIMAGEDAGNLSFAQYKDAVRYYAHDLGTAP